ncbi:unnamed protein product [Darwinula stevensoni]|uniref:MARVEL domain-containing protein n=1 Tax=Darwinula stevensoni TaxID=69355 RepID=A0A7R8XK88_9CRUS|nr:unnamed protein product [Darwinula stevensoni]CAG0894974.1 unnamed protein product [Darwinula stevensoni]
MCVRRRNRPCPPPAYAPLHLSLFSLSPSVYCLGLRIEASGVEWGASRLKPVTFHHEIMMSESADKPAKPATGSPSASDSIQLNLSYFVKTPAGILKLVQLVVGIICMACGSPAWWSPYHWFLFVAVSAFVGTLLWSFVYLLSLKNAINLPINWTLSELLFTAIFTVLYIVAFIVLLASNPHGKYIAAGVSSSSPDHQADHIEHFTSDLQYMIVVPSGRYIVAGVEAKNRYKEDSGDPTVGAIFVVMGEIQGFSITPIFTQASAMSHTVTVTRTTTSTTSAIILNTGYVKTIPGLLKFLELIIGAVCVGIIGYYVDRYGRDYAGLAVPELFFLLIATACMIATFCLFLSCLLSVATAAILPKTIFEVVYHFIATGLYLACAITLLVEVSEMRKYSRSEKLDAYLATAILGLINAGLYLCSAFLAVKSYRMA